MPSLILHEWVEICLSWVLSFHQVSAGNRKSSFQRDGRFYEFSTRDGMSCACFQLIEVARRRTEVAGT